MIAVFGLGCSTRGDQTGNGSLGSYSITPVDLRDVQLADQFWLPVVQRVQKETIPYALEKCRQEGRLDNFLIAGGEMKGEVRGRMPFDRLSKGPRCRS
ncbi:MAG: hypothetical protein P8Z37_15960 [Acidobacteriota bacterium]